MTMTWIASAFPSVSPSTSTTVTFSNIPQAFNHLQVRFAVRNGGSLSRMRMRVNGDSGTSYATHVLVGDGTFAVSAGATNQTYTLGTAMAESTVLANAFSVGVLDALDYSVTSKNKTFRLLDGGDYNGTGAVNLWSGLWLNTAAISSLSFIWENGAAFGAGSRFDLYGYNVSPLTGA